MIGSERLVPRVAAESRYDPIVIHSPGWMKNALCREVGGEIFFERETTHLAQRVCNRCPVADPCREYGASEEFGVWGGVTANQRDLSKVRATCMKGHRKSRDSEMCWVCLDGDDSVDSQEVA